MTKVFKDMQVTCIYDGVDIDVAAGFVKAAKQEGGTTVLMTKNDDGYWSLWVQSDEVLNVDIFEWEALAKGYLWSDR